MARKLGAAAAILGVLAGTSAWAQGHPSIVTAENFYGDVARQIAGPEATVTSVLSNPNQDPHLFEVSPSVARAVSDAQVVVYNGADYDPWMAKLVAASGRGGRLVIVVADLVGRKPGQNPHIWYDPPTMPAYARALATALATADPAHRAEHERRLQAFLDSLEPLQARVASLRSRFAGTPVTATEPVFGYMAAAVGLTMRNERFQLAVMNGTEPRASDIAAFEADLRQHRVRALLYNSQAAGAAAMRLFRIARVAGVPVVGITETEPEGVSFQEWMLGELDALERALAGHSP